MRSKVVLCFIIMSVLVMSCQKEASFDPNNPNGGSGGSTSGQSIIGNWKFINSHVITKSIGVSGNIKSITTSDYTTIDNGGVFTINATTITSKDFKYSVNTTAKAYFYESNILIDSFEVPMVVGMPASTTSYTYRQIRPDSIFVDNGFRPIPILEELYKPNPQG
jgi:hypothetical protein